MSKADKLITLFTSFVGSVGSILKPDLPNLWPGKSANPGANAKANKIAYLDGLRGVSALVVYLTHHAMYAHEEAALHRAFGWAGRYYFVAFPGIRIGWSGGSLATGLFFLISGYVCSLSPYNLIHRGNVDKLAKNLGVNIPRRFFRLYFPVFWITLLIVTSWHLFGVVSSNNATELPKANYLIELRAWLANFFRLTYFLAPPGRGTLFDPINPHLWYIPDQFRGMMLMNAVMGTLLAFHQWGTNARLLAVLATVSYLIFLVDEWAVALCLMGMLICDLDLLQDKDQLPKAFYRLQPFALRGWMWYVVLVVGIWLAGCPRSTNTLENDPGWFYLGKITPSVVKSPVWYWVFWAATFIFVSIPRIPGLRSCFEMSIPLYFGKIAFGLYLVHGPILWTIGARVYAAVGRVHTRAAEDIPSWWIDLLPLPDWGPMGIEVNYIVAQAILLPFTLWIAGIATKLLDEPSGRIGNWLFDPKRY